MKRLLLLLTISTFAVFNLFAQFSSVNNYVTRNWTSNDGLPGNTVCDVIQGKDGYMYFGTYESLVKFDGYDFKILNKYYDSNYSFISARAIFEDSTGAIWVGSNDEGAQKITKDSYTNYSVTNGLPNNSIRSFTEDTHNNIWIGTAGGLVYITPEGSIEHPKTEDGINLEHVVVYQLFSDTAGRIWLVTGEEKGLYLYSNDKFVHYKDLDIFGNYMISAMGQDKKGNLWFGLTLDGIVKVANGIITKVETNTLLDNEQTNAIYCDKSGALWFGTQKGLVLYQDGTFSVYKEEPLSNSSINKIFEDREGNIWLATDNDGIAKISLGKFKTIKLNIPVNAICEDKEGQVWVGADDGLYCYKNEELIENELTLLCKNTRVRHLELAKNGDLLVNLYSKPAQLRYTKEGIKSWTSDEGLAGNKTRVSIEASNGDLYCGTTTGLSIIKPDNTIINHNTSNDFECEYIMCIYEDKNQNIWIGTDGGGIYVLKDGNIINKYSTDQGLAGNVIFKIFQDDKGFFWICTGAGISRFDGTYFFNYNSSKGLGSDSVFQMIIDQNNKVWMISNRGISTVTYEDMTLVAENKKQQLDSKFYKQNDGLKTSGANSTALSMMDQFGRIWLTLSDGFAIYDPLKEKSTDVNPIIIIESIKVDDIEYTDLSKPIVIPPKAKNIDISYTGLAFTAPERNRFSYKLDGFDDSFSEYTGERKAHYNTLAPGDYTFYVNLKNSDGISVEAPAFALFVQKPSFYQRKLFWIALVVILFGTFGAIIHGVIHTQKKRQLMLETKIQMATVELEMAKDDSDRLLKNILPVPIAERMKGLGGEKTIADTYESVTVLFADIVGFTKTTSNETAENIVTSLNDLITRFDKRASKMGVEKIKTIGDCYMAACGVPEANPKHSEIMLKFAIGMFKDVAEYNKTAKIQFNIRIGLNSGPVIAGVIGQNKFIYDIWGDTVNVASRMESNATPGHIRITEAVKNHIETDTVKLKCRMEEVNVKGKGLMKTYELPEK